MSDWQITTPINRFEHTETESLVDVVSVIHIGEPDYYSALGRYVMGRQDEGFIVHYEEVSYDPEAALPKGFLMPIKNKIDNTITDIDVDTSLLVRGVTGLVFQNDDMIFRPEQAQNVDLDHTGQLGAHSLVSQLRILLAYKISQARFHRWAKQDPSIFEERLFKQIKKVSDQYDHEGVTPGRKRKPWDIDARNEAALHGLDEELTTDEHAKVVMLWGLGHLAGLRAGLETRGYQHTGIEEVEAITCLPVLQRSIEEYMRRCVVE